MELKAKLSLALAFALALGCGIASAADAPVPGTDPMTGLSLAQLTETGAGQGNTHTTHPGARP